jgi:GT2 family glycosyltransferase
MTDVAVVILNYNGKKYLKAFLPNLISCTPDARIIIADNASTDDSVSFLEANFPELTIIQLEKNYGFAGGYNHALKQVSADYYAIINSDIEVTIDWLSPLRAFLDEHADYAAVQGKIRSFHQKSHFEYAGAAGGFVDNLGYPYCRGRIFDTIEEDKGQYDSIVHIDWTSGACMLIRSEIFHEFGGFDEDFFAHMEEIDLCWRIRAKGYKLAAIPESVVYHVGGGTLNKTSPFKTYLNFKNGLSLLVKNLPARQLIYKLPLRLILDGLAAIKFAVESSPSHLIAILKAHVHFYRHARRDFKKRDHSHICSSKSVLKSYYLQGKRTYDRLF